MPLQSLGDKLHRCYFKYIKVRILLNWFVSKKLKFFLCQNLHVCACICMYTHTELWEKFHISFTAILRILASVAFYIINCIVITLIQLLTAWFDISVVHTDICAL